MRCGDRHQQLPDNPERFDRVVCVLGREAISSGRHYWEVRTPPQGLFTCVSHWLHEQELISFVSCEQVQVGGKTDWDLGVAKQSINRKGKIEVTPSNGYWFLSLRDK